MAESGFYRISLNFPLDRGRGNSESTAATGCGARQCAQEVHACLGHSILVIWEGRPVLAMSEPYDRGYVGWQKRTKVIKLSALLIPS